MRRVGGFLTKMRRVRRGRSLQCSCSGPGEERIMLTTFSPGSTSSVRFLRHKLPPFVTRAVLRCQETNNGFEATSSFSHICNLSSRGFGVLGPCVRVSRTFQQGRSALRFVGGTRGSALTICGCPRKALISLGRTSAARLGGVPKVNDNVTHVVITCQGHLKNFCSAIRLGRIGCMSRSVLG